VRIGSCQPSQLRALSPHGLQGMASSPLGHLFAAGDDHVIFGRIVKRVRLAAETHQPIGLARHRRDDDRDLVPGILTSRV
jgi:hypothetical protein